MNFVGGECKNVSACLFRGYSEKVPAATGKSQNARVYLEPISGSMQIPIEGRSLLAFSAAKNMQKKRRGIGVSRKRSLPAKPEDTWLGSDASSVDGAYL